MFSQRLREIRTEREMSQTQLALLIKATQTQISKWEKGIIEPSLNQLQLLSDALEVSTDYLLGRENELGIINISSKLTQFQAKLLDVVNKLPRDDQFQVLGFAQALAN